MKKLEQQDIEKYIAESYEANAYDLTCVVFGYFPSGKGFDKIDKNHDLYRQFVTVKEALLNPNSSLICIEEDEDKRIVKRDSFFKWIKFEWGHYPEVMDAYGLWKKYKNRKKSHSVSHKNSQKRKVYDFIDKTLDEFWNDNHKFFDKGEDEMKKILREEVYKQFKYPSGTVVRYTREGFNKYYPKYIKKNQ
jgi:hypothetical protein